MRAVRVIGIVLIACIVILLGLYLREGFSDFTPAHNAYVDKNKRRYNSLGMALASSKSEGNLGTDTKPLVGTDVKVPYDGNGNFREEINDKYPLNPGKSDLSKIIETCESIKTMDCSAFDDPKFKLNCGMCLDIGENSEGQPATGGLVLLPQDKKSADDGKSGNFIPNYLPTLGSCPANKMVSTKEQCLRLKKELECAKNASYDIPGCSQCYADGTYFPVDPSTDRTTATLKVVGSGILYFLEDGNWTVPGDKVLSDTPISINLTGKEGTRFTIYLDSDASDKVSIGGYLTGTTPNGEMTVDLARLIIVDTGTQRKPTTMGVKKIDGIDIRMMSVKPNIPKALPTRWAGRERKIISGNWMEHSLIGVNPFTFIDTSSQEASRCLAGPYITKPESAAFLESDPCYKKGSGPGNYNLECLQNTMDSNGCFSSGKGYPKDATTAATLMEKGRTINDIANYIYEQAVITSTGNNLAGQKLSINDISKASLFCTGNEVLSPCDIGNKDAGPLSVECLDYLWKNQGSVNPGGSTYFAGSMATSLFKKGPIPRFCQSSGTLAPVGDDGKPNIGNIAFWKSKGGVEAVKSIMKGIHETANSDMLDSDKSEAILQCYGTSLADRPAGKPVDLNPDTCQYPSGSDISGLCKSKFTDMGCWNDTEDRAIAGVVGYGHTMETCGKIASDRGAKYFAIQDGSWCTVSTGSDNYAKYGKASSQDCPNGGAWVNHVWQIGNSPPPSSVSRVAAAVSVPPPVAPRAAPPAPPPPAPPPAPTVTPQCQTSINIILGSLAVIPQQQMLGMAIRAGLNTVDKMNYFCTMFNAFKPGGIFLYPGDMGALYAALMYWKKQYPNG